MATKETINKAWSPTPISVGTYVTTTQGVNDNLSAATVAPVTPPIPSTSRISGSRVMVFINITGAGSDVAADMFMEMSPDGTNWTTHEGVGTDYITLSSDIKPNETGYKVFLVDLTSFRSPFYRIGFNSGGLSVGTGIRFQMGYSYLK